MAVNIAETFELLFDKNNKAAYKALQEVQKENEETNCVYRTKKNISSNRISEPVK